MTTIPLWNLQWLFLLFIFGQCNVQYVQAEWPSLKFSAVQILLLSQDEIYAPESVEFLIHSRALFKAAILLSHQYNITINGQSIGWEIKETGEKTINALSNTCEVISRSNIVGIVGPIFSRDTPVIAELGEKVGTPVVSYAATDPALSNINAYPAFHRTVPSDNAAAVAIVKLFLRFNWTSCVIIYQNDAYGSGGVKIITEEFNKNGLTVANTLVFDIATLKMRDNLKNVLTTSSTRIVLVWAGFAYTSLIIQNALDDDVLGPNFIWILSSSVSLKQFNRTDYPKLIGMLAIEPTVATDVQAKINTTLLNAAYDLWKKYEPQTFPTSTKVDYYALFAFDATWLLIQSLQKFCSTSENSSFPCVSFTNSSVCFNRHFLNSGMLFDIINNITLLGVSGLVQFDSSTTDRINGNYYFAQNVQPSSGELNFIPVLKYSDNYNWQDYAGQSVIIWPGKTLTLPNGGAKLHGVKLRIGLVQAAPFTIVETVINQFGQNTTKLSGYMLDLINHLKDKMGFIPDIRLVPLNQTYASLVKAIEDNVYDIIIGDITVTATRRQTVGFSNAILDNSLRIVMRKSDDVSVQLWSFMKPFSWKLWLFILLTIIIASVLVYIFEADKQPEWENKSIPYKCGMSIWYCFGNLVGYGVDFKVTTTAGRLLTTGLYILSIILVASYTANLASQLTISNSKNVISGIDDLKSGKIPFNRIGIRVGTASEEFYLREISSGSRNYYPLRSRQEQYDSLLNNIIDVAFLDTNIAEYSVNYVYCNLTIVGEGFDNGALAIITPMQWLYGRDLDVNILSLTETGVLNEMKRTWLQNKPKCAGSSRTPSSIGIDSLSGIFLIFVIVCVVSLLYHTRMRIYYFVAAILPIRNNMERIS